jgi:chromosome segregation ATPase
MSSILDRLNQELEDLSKRAQSALDQGRLKIELMRIRRRQDNAASDLGLLVHRRERGGEVDPARVESLLSQLDDVEKEISKVEREIAAAREEAVTVDEEPAPSDVPTGEAEVVEESDVEPESADD